MACPTSEKKTKRSDDSTDESCLTRTEIMQLHGISRLPLTNKFYEKKYTEWIRKICLVNDYQFPFFGLTYTLEEFNYWKKKHDNTLKHCELAVSDLAQSIQKSEEMIEEHSWLFVPGLRDDTCRLDRVRKDMNDLRDLMDSLLMIQERMTKLQNHPPNREIFAIVASFL